MRLALACAALAAVACARLEPLDPPPSVDLANLVAHGRRAAVVEPERLTALYVAPKRAGIGRDEVAVELLELVAVLTADGELVITDVLHRDAPGAFGYGKLDGAKVSLSSPHGSFAGARRLFTPAEDVLAVLDTGYQIDVRVGALGQRITLRPLYDADRYRPYVGAGAPGLSGEVAVRGGGGC